MLQFFIVGRKSVYPVVSDWRRVQEEFVLEAKLDQRWLKRIVDLINPLRDPSLTVAVVLTFIEEAGAA